MRDTRVFEEELETTTSGEAPKQDERTLLGELSTESQDATRVDRSLDTPADTRDNIATPILEDIDRSKPIILPDEKVKEVTSEFTYIPTADTPEQKERTLFGELSTEKQDATRIDKGVDIPTEVRDQESYLPRGSKEIFNQELKNVTAELIGKEEQFVVPQMNFAFGDYGFSFEKAGALGDKMVVKSKSGNAITIDLDPILGSTESSEAEKLTKFLSDNRVESQFLAQKEGIYASEQKKITTAKELNDKC
jgi:hypothetical protein